MRAKQIQALTLLEMLLAMVLFICMMALAMPAWRSLNHSVMQRGTTNLLIATLEQARMAAIEKKSNTWIVFRHRSLPLPDDFCTLQQNDDGSIVLLASWISLPKGTVFLIGPESSLNELPPTDVIAALEKNFLPLGKNENLRVIEFNSSGAVIQPASQENELQLTLGTATSIDKTKIITTNQISLSPLTGRAFLNK